MEEIANKYLNGPMYFSGSDCTVVLNGSVIGEVRELKYVENLSTFRIRGHLDVIVFDGFSFREKLKQHEQNTLILHCMNEYGQSFTLDFKYIEFLERIGGIEVDDVIMEEKYTFECVYITTEVGKELDEFLVN